MSEEAKEPGAQTNDAQNGSPENIEAAMSDLQAEDQQAAVDATADALEQVAEQAADADDAAPAEDDTDAAAGGAAPFAPPDLNEANGRDRDGGPVGDIGLLDDVELNVRIELGRAEMYIEDVLRLSVGSVVELDKQAGDPVDIYVNDRLVARGEVLVLNDAFCVRINDIISPIPELDAS